MLFTFEARRGKSYRRITTDANTFDHVCSMFGWNRERFASDHLIGWAEHDGDLSPCGWKFEGWKCSCYIETERL